MTSYQMPIRFINLVLTIVELFLGLRFVLRLFGANPGAGFVQWIYDTSEPLLAPFRGIFPVPVIDPGYVLEFPTLFAMIIYAIIAWLLVELIYFIQDSINTRKERKYQEK